MMQQPYSPPSQPIPPTPPVQPKTSGLAITSLVTALLCLGVVPVIFGHVALSKIKRSMGALTGQGMAIAGLVIGYVQIILFFVLIIPMLFIGARAYKKGSDRAGCILNQRNVQQAVRSYQGMKGQGAGEPIDWKEIIGTGKFLDKEPTCPAHGKYTFKPSAKMGELAVECSLCGEPDKHVPQDHSDW